MKYLRVKASTMWGLVTHHDEDINMVTPNLQPRPHFAAMAVLTDALADAAFVASRSQNGITIFEWKRGNGTLFTAWADTGTQELALQVPTGQFTSMDLMGNRAQFAAPGGRTALRIGVEPRYILGGEIKIAP